MVDTIPTIYTASLEECMDLLFAETRQTVHCTGAAETNLINGTPGKTGYGTPCWIDETTVGPTFLSGPPFWISAISSCSGRHCQGFGTLSNSPGHGGPTAPHRHAANHPGSQVVFCGGLQLYLDLNRAFDTVWRQKLFQHLAQIEVSEDVLVLVSTWHQNTEYVLSSNLESRHIPIGLGLRQGCKIAPLLWIAFMDLFLTLLRPRTGARWILDHLTLYADDIHVGCLFHNAAEFHCALTNFGHVLDALEELQLSLSYSKSFVIFQHAGTNSRAPMKGTFTRSAEGMKIHIPRGNGDRTLLPVRAKGKYLGVIMSYSAFEQQTWQHRKAAAWCAFSRLKPWFRSRAIPTTCKLHLWRTCVLSILTYGLFATNVTTSILFSFHPSHIK